MSGAKLLHFLGSFPNTLKTLRCFLRQLDNWKKKCQGHQVIVILSNFIHVYATVLAEGGDDRRVCGSPRSRWPTASASL